MNARTQLRQQLQGMTNDELVQWMRTPRPFDPQVNSAAICLAELKRRKRNGESAPMSDKRQTPTWRDEFPADFAVPDLIAGDDRLEDVSWHNDVCPSFILKGYDTSDGALPDIRLWVNHPDREQREFVDQPRLWVTDGERAFFCESDNDDDAAAAVAAVIAACTRAQEMRADAKLEDVANMLRENGFAAWVEHPHCVAIAATHGLWFWGTVNENWGGDLMTEGGDNLDTRTTTVPSTCPSAALIAAAIEAAMLGDEARVRCPFCGCVNLATRTICNACSEPLRKNLERFGQRRKDGVR